MVVRATTGARIAVCCAAVTQQQHTVPAPAAPIAQNISETKGGPRGEFYRSNKLKDIGRGDRIRTYDPLFPKQMRYQAALRPEPS
jgi:hypothetical protein